MNPELPTQNIDPDTTPPAPSVPPSNNLPEEEFEVRHKWYRYIEEKYVYIPLLIFILIPIIGILIVTRYDTLGVFYKQNYSLAVVDGKTLEPLIGAKVSLRGQTLTTNKFGEAEFAKLKVGKSPISVSRPYYKSIGAIVLIPLTNHRLHVFALETTGVELPITVINQVNKTGVNQAVIHVSNNSEITNPQGQTTMALPTSSVPLTATVTAPGYNPLTTTVSEQTKNVLQMIPSGKIYYLSSSGGTINVVESNLDGSSPQVVVAGTSGQTAANTTLYPSADWKYLALFTTKSGSSPSISVINTSNNKVISVDQDAQGFDYYGWTASDDLIYQYKFTAIGAGNGSHLKSYNAATNNDLVLDTGQASGFDSLNYVSQNIVGANILANGTILYTKSWAGTNESVLYNSDTTYNSIQPDGKLKEQLASVSYSNYKSPPVVVFTSPNSLNLAFESSSAPTIYYSYSNGKLSKSTEQSVISSIASPPINSIYYMAGDGSAVAWSSPVASGNAINVGNSDGGSGSVVASLGNNFTPLGWYTKSYLVVSENGNQMFILPSSGTNNQNNLLKVSDYQ